MHTGRRGIEPACWLFPELLQGVCPHPCRARCHDVVQIGPNPAGKVRAHACALHREMPRPHRRAASLAGPAATALGATLADRLRINATWALRGMWRAGQGGKLLFVGNLQSRFK